MELNLNYSVPIKESFSEDGDFIIQGTAINATTTDNGHTFLVEELKPAAKSLNGVPLLVDHDAKVENIKGRVMEGVFNDVDEKIDFRARVVDEKTRELIKNGLLNTVSVGANVKDIQEGDDGNLIARGIKFKELSLVAVPADDGATFGIAMSEAYNSMKEENDILEDSKLMKQVKDSEYNIKNGNIKSFNSKSNLQELKGGKKNMENEKILEAIESMGKTLSESSDKKLTELSEKIEAVEKSFSEKLEALKESDVDEVKPEVETDEVKPEEETKPEEDTEEEEEGEEEEVDESAKYNIVEGNGSLRGSSFSYEW